MMEQQRYEIHIKGHLSADWLDWFDGLKVANLDGGEAVISGHIPDQAALHAVLARVYSLNPFSCSNVPRLRETPPSALPLGPAGRAKDGVRIRAQLLSAQPAGGIVGEQRLLTGSVSRRSR